MYKYKRIGTIFFLFLFFVSGIFCGYFFGFFENGPEKVTLIFSREEKSNFHSALLDQKEFLEKSFSKQSKEKTQGDNDIKGLVVPHHLLASRLIANAFNSIQPEMFKTVILISPNHFSKGRGQIISSIYDWKTPYGVLEADGNLIEEMRDKNILNIDETPFSKEHGIYNVAPFIKKVMPEAKIVPIIIKDNLTQEESYRLAEKLRENLGDNTLIVASFDFSHYLPSNVADFHDAKSLAVLENFDYEAIDFLDIDSKPALKVFLKYLELEGAQNFTFFENSNSAKIINNVAAAETTSYITGVFSFGGKKENKDVTLLSFGDLMLDRYIRATIDKNSASYPYSKIERFLGGSDLVLANLEGPFTDFPPKLLHPDNTTFTFDPKSISVLKKYGFNIFNLANNHSFNFGKDGFSQSIDYLDKNGIEYFGTPNNLENISTIKNVRGVKIGFVGYNELGADNFDEIIDEIKKIKQNVDFIVVYTHWGIEYKTDFSESQQEKARELIDAGADVVLGSHPHVVEPIEIYKNKVIFYSMGNFLFDQRFSKETMRGLGVGIVLGEEKNEYYLFPTEIDKNFQITLSDFVESGNILKGLAEKSVIPKEFKEQIINGKILIFK
jgi:poly-gamma-glutamate synthesis protein (capsule biosynthesis protein)